MGGAPLPLLGSFHEFSVATAEVAATVAFYEELGFTQAPTTDAFSHRYGVLTDGRLCIGVHGRGGASPVLTFVRQGIAAQLAAFEAAGIELSQVRTGEEVFNQVAFDAACGQPVAVLEARTFSPADRSPREPSLLGEFTEVSLPAADFEAARGCWEGLGFVATDEEDLPYPHLPLTSDLLDLSFHRPRLWDRPVLVFRSPDAGQRIERLRTRGLVAAPPPRGLGGTAAVLEAPDGTPLLMVAGD
jgi:hypothetical protein